MVGLSVVGLLGSASIARSKKHPSIRSTRLRYQILECGCLYGSCREVVVAISKIVVNSCYKLILVFSLSLQGEYISCSENQLP